MTTCACGRARRSPRSMASTRGTSERPDPGRARAIAGRRFAYLARAVRSATTWQASLDVIDLGEARVVATMDLSRVTHARGSAVLAWIDRRSGSPPTAGTPWWRRRRAGRPVRRPSPTGCLDRRAGRLVARPAVDVDALAEPGDERHSTRGWVAFASPDTSHGLPVRQAGSDADVPDPSLRARAAATSARSTATPALGDRSRSSSIRRTASPTPGIRATTPCSPWTSCRVAGADGRQATTGPRRRHRLRRRRGRPAGTRPSGPTATRRRIGRSSARSSGRPTAGSCSPSAKADARASRSGVRVFDAQTLRLARTMAGPGLLPLAGPVRARAFVALSAAQA